MLFRSGPRVNLLQTHTWPGNIRELQHAVERAVVLATGPVLGVADFDGISRLLGENRTIEITLATKNNSAISLPTLNLAEAEESLIAEALRSTNNNRTHAAALLGIGVRTLRKKLNAPTPPAT